MTRKTVAILAIVLGLYGCSSTGSSNSSSSGGSEELSPAYVKQDTPISQFNDDWRACRERVRSGEFQEEFNRNQVATGGDPLAQAFAKGVAEGRQRAKLSFLCLENDGYERILVPKGTFKRIEPLPTEQQVQEVNKLLAEQPRDRSVREELLGANS